MRSGGVIQPDITRWNVISVAMKREEELKKTCSHVWEPGRAFCSCTLLAFGSRTIECLLPCGFEQPAAGFAFYPELLLNLNICRANKAAPKDNMHLLKFILMELD